MENANGHNRTPYEKLVFRIGRRKSDPLVTVLTHPLRAHFAYKGKWINDAVFLELVEPGRDRTYPCICLIHRDWKYPYCLRDRGNENWKEEDYFKLAERLIWEKGITNP